MTKVSPSILSANFAEMGNACEMLEKYNADYVHCDVMDGVFVGQITFGSAMVKALKNYTKLPLDVHLMIVNPLKHIESFVNAGSDIITFHYEAVEDSLEVIREIKKYGVKAGISIKPNTPPEVLENILPEVDLVLIMSVEPGKGGQKFMPSALDKIKYCADFAKEHNKELLIEVDGGINAETGKQCVDNGANVLVAGSYVFKAEDMAKAIESLATL